MAEQPRILVVLIEYSEIEKHVMVRYVGPVDPSKTLAPLEADNYQNYVQVFEGIDMGAHIGFKGLIPSEDDE